MQNQLCQSDRPVSPCGDSQCECRGARLRLGRRATISDADARRDATVIQFDAQDRHLTALMRAAQNGDRTAYEKLARSIVPVVKGIARRQGISADFIDDVVQDTLLTMHRYRQSYDANRSFMAWLTMIVQRRAIDAMRKHKRISSAEILDPDALENLPDPLVDPEQAVEQSDRRIMLEGMIAALPLPPPD